MSVLEADQTIVANGVLTVETGGITIQYLDWIELVNASAFALSASIGSFNFHIPAWYSYPFNLRDGNHKLQPGVVLPMKLTVGAQTIPGPAAVSTLHTTLYQNGETPANTQPGPLGGSPINLSIATSIVSTGYPAATSIVFGRPTADLAILGATNIYNNGVADFGDATYQGEITLSGPSGNSTTITNDSITTPALTTSANATVGAILSVVGLSSLDNGFWSSDGAGNQDCVSVTFTAGKISRVKAFGPYTVTTAPTLFNHNLGAVPDLILLQIVGTSTAAFSAEYDDSTLTSIQAKLTSNSASGVTVRGLAFKF